MRPRRLRWELQSRIGKTNPVSTRALFFAKLFFHSQIRSAILHDREADSTTMGRTCCRVWWISGIDPANNALWRIASQWSLETLDANRQQMMGRYHFLDMAETTLASGLRSRDGTGPLLAVALFSLGHRPRRLVNSANLGWTVRSPCAGAACFSPPAAG